jgi:hypothetical protein
VIAASGREGNTPVKKTISIPTTLREAERQSKDRPVLPVSVAKEVPGVEQEDYGLSTDPLEKERVAAALEEILSDYKAAHKNMEVAVLRQPYELRGIAIHFLLAGELQQDIFMRCKPELTGLFRRKLHHAKVEVTYEIKEEAQNQSKNLYTASERLQYLLKKSPALTELKKRFDLETDF